MFLSSELKSKNIIFSDAFDTVIFRRAHPFELANRFCYALKNKLSLDEVSTNTLFVLRKNAFKCCEMQNPPFDECMKHFYTLLNENTIHSLLPNEKEFVKICCDIEFSIELGTQYANRRQVERYRKWRQKGKKIYIVSDFHLGREYISQFLQFLGISDCFDDIFVSCDFNTSKADGKLYHHVLKQLQIDPSEVLMIGDNPVSDGKMAETNGISTLILKNLRHKAINQLTKRFFSNSNNPYDLKKAINFQMKSKDNPLSEYFVLFYVFTKRLYAHLQERNAQNVVFLSREGYFLKEVFEEYQNLCVPTCNKIKTHYLKCSRYAMSSIVNGDKEQQNAFLHYISSFGITGTWHIVDVGWRGSMQQGIEFISSVPTIGFYVGVFGDLPYSNNNCERHGLIFEDDGAVKSCFFDLYRANTQIYEQLLSGPHGATISYSLTHNKEIIVHEDWPDNEHSFFDIWASHLQHHGKNIIKALCVWDKLKLNKRTEDWILANMVLKNALYMSKERLRLIKSMDVGFVNNKNIAQHLKGLNYDRKSVQLNVLEFLRKPYLYLRFIAKLQRMFSKKRFYAACYNLFFSKILYFWIATSALISKENKKIYK